MCEREGGRRRIREIKKMGRLSRFRRHYSKNDFGWDLGMQDLVKLKNTSTYIVYFGSIQQRLD